MPSITVTTQTTIRRSPDEIFAFIAEPENDPQWCPTVEEIHQIAGDGPGLGAKYAMSHAPGGMKFEAVVEIVAYVPYERMEWRMTDKGHVLDGVYLLEEVEEGTRLTQKSHFRFTGLLRIPSFFLKGVIQKDIQKEMDGQFEKLKRMLELEPANEVL